MKIISPICFSVMGCMENSLVWEKLGREFVADRWEYYRIAYEVVHLKLIKLKPPVF